MFNHFQEHNLKLKTHECKFFWNEINYLAHHVSKEGVRPSKENLKAVAEFAPPQTYKEIWAFLDLVGHYWQFLKCFTYIAQPLHEHLSGEGASKQSKWVLLLAEARDTFEMLKKACLDASVLVFANFYKPFLLETDTSKLGLGAVLSQKQIDGQYHPEAYASQSLTTHEHNYHSMKQEFLALKWVIGKQFNGYLLWKPFIIRTDNNLLTYVMTMPNLDATQHWLVESLPRFTFSIEYQKGHDNVPAVALRQVTLKVDAKTVKSILDGVTVGMMEKADAHDPVVAKADEEIHKLVQETVILAQAACINLHVKDWVNAQQEDPILKTAIEWISAQKVQDLRNLLGYDANTEEGRAILPRVEEANALPRSPLLSPHCTGICSPKAHWVATMNGCHRDAGHQGQQQTLCLLHYQFWWPGIAFQMQKAISNCERCIQHEGTHAKASMWPIIVTAALELLHIDFTSIEAMMELDQPPNVMNVWFFVTT